MVYLCGHLELLSTDVFFGGQFPSDPKFKGAAFETVTLLKTAGLYFIYLLFYVFHQFLQSLFLIHLDMFYVLCGLFSTTLIWTVFFQQVIDFGCTFPPFPFFSWSTRLLLAFFKLQTTNWKLLCSCYSRSHWIILKYSFHCMTWNAGYMLLLGNKQDLILNTCLLQ